MVVASLRRSSLLALLLTSAACRELSLQRSRASAPADTASSEAGSRERTPRTGKKQPRTDAAAESAAFAEIRRALRRLVAVEETFFAENGTYTDEPSFTGLSPDKNISIRFLWLSRDGWAASGTHAALQGKDCVIFVGAAEAAPTTMKLVRLGREGVPVCDERTSATKPRAAPPTPAAPTAAAPQPDTANALDLLDPRVVMKVDLRNLARSQETYWAMQGSYARRTESLALQYLWHRGVQIKILSADAESWSARATHARFPGKSCVIWFGAVSQRPRTDAERRAEGRAGVPVCDG